MTRVQAFGVPCGTVRRCIHARRAGGCLSVNTLTGFEIRWEAGDGDVELVGPGVEPMRFHTIREAYEHFRRCFAPLAKGSLTIRAALPFEVKR